MLLFIDESGDPGISVGNRYFLVACVSFSTKKIAREADKAIEGLRRAGIHKGEFKFNKCSHAVKDKFFDRISAYDFDIYAVIWDTYNDVIFPPVPSHMNPSDVIHNWLFDNLLNSRLASGLPILSDAHLRLDGQNSSTIKRKLGFEKRRMNALISGSISSIEMRDSRRDNLIQLADMVAGALARSLKSPERAHSGKWLDKLDIDARNIWRK